MIIRASKRVPVKSEDGAIDTWAGVGEDGRLAIPSNRKRTGTRAFKVADEHVLVQLDGGLWSEQHPFVYGKVLGPVETLEG